MLGPLSSLGIAETVFYVPIVPLSIYLQYRNWGKGPRYTWYPFIFLALMRLASGPVLIALSKNPTNISLFIAATVLLNVGVIWLLYSTYAFVSMALPETTAATTNTTTSNSKSRLDKIVRLAIFLAIILLVVGSATTTSIPGVARVLQILGYGLFALILLGLVGFAASLLRKKAGVVGDNKEDDRVILTSVLLASPFLILRNVYGLLYYATNYYVLIKGIGGEEQEEQYGYVRSIWNPISGSQVAFALMGLLPEYIALCLYFYAGFSISPRQGKGASGDDPVASEGLMVEGNGRAGR